MWRPPLDFARWRLTNDSGSFVDCPANVGEIPMGAHVGAFGVQRKHHIHEGIDLYCSSGAVVRAVERGIVVVVEPFTGPNAGSPWWLDTQCVLVEGASGVVVYGEIATEVPVGSVVDVGAPLGTVARVLRVNKGRPQDMLHLELHAPGTRQCPEWTTERPATLLDPTPHCLNWARRDQLILT